MKKNEKLYMVCAEDGNPMGWSVSQFYLAHHLNISSKTLERYKNLSVIPSGTKPFPATIFTFAQAMTHIRKDNRWRKEIGLSSRDYRLVAVEYISPRNRHYGSLP